MTEIISVISGKGGVGKTTFTSNIGVALSNRGKSVLLIDGNVSGANLGMYLGVHNYCRTLNDVLDGKVDFVNAVTNLDPDCVLSKYFHLIPASLVVDSADLSRLGEFLSALVGHYDYIIIDGAAGCDDEVRNVVDVSDKVIIVVNPEVSSLSNAMLVRQLAESRGKDVLGVVVTRMRGETFEVSPDEVLNFFGLPVLGVIREEIKVKGCLAQGAPVLLKYPRSGVSKDFMYIAGNMLSGSSGIKKDSFFQRIVDSV